mgnify:CR=1 FL=1
MFDGFGTVGGHLDVVILCQSMVGFPFLLFIPYGVGVGDAS